MVKKAEFKANVLTTLKAQWKVAVQEQFEREPEKVRNADISKNAKEIMRNPTVKASCLPLGIKQADIEQILTEIRDEVCVKKEE